MKKDRFFHGAKLLCSCSHRAENYRALLKKLLELMENMIYTNDKLKDEFLEG